MRKINIAIVGLGNIGSYLYKYLKKNKQILAKKTIVYQILFAYLLKIKIVIEGLRLIINNG